MQAHVLYTSLSAFLFPCIHTQTTAYRKELGTKRGTSSRVPKRFPTNPSRPPAHLPVQLPKNSPASSRQAGGSAYCRAAWWCQSSANIYIYIQWFASFCRFASLFAKVFQNGKFAHTVRWCWNNLTGKKIQRPFQSDQLLLSRIRSGQSLVTCLAEIRMAYLLGLYPATHSYMGLLHFCFKKNIYI